MAAAAAPPAGVSSPATTPAARLGASEGRGELVDVGQRTSGPRLGSPRRIRAAASTPDPERLGRGRGVFPGPAPRRPEPGRGKDAPGRRRSRPRQRSPRRALSSTAASPPCSPGSSSWLGMRRSRHEHLGPIVDAFESTMRRRREQPWSPPPTRGSCPKIRAPARRGSIGRSRAPTPPARGIAAPPFFRREAVRRGPPATGSPRPAGSGGRGRRRRRLQAQGRSPRSGGGPVTGGKDGRRASSPARFPR